MGGLEMETMWERLRGKLSRLAERAEKLNYTELDYH